jgi:hypothetical protein
VLFNPTATQGVPYEIVGLCYYLMFMYMGSRRSKGRFSPRSRVLTLVAAIAMVGSVPFGYAGNAVGVMVMFALAAASLASSVFDTQRGR